MADQLQTLLLVKNDEEYSELNGVEYLFQASLEEGKLTDILEKFHCAVNVSEVLTKEVLSLSSLNSDWKALLFYEVNSLIKLLPDGAMQVLDEIKEGVVDYDTEEMFTLRAMMGPVIRKASKGCLTSHERAFLNDFFYGIDFTHWTKWAIMLHYTDIAFRTPNILSVRRNGINFAIEGRTLICSINQ